MVLLLLVSGEGWAQEDLTRARELEELLGSLTRAFEVGRADSVLAVLEVEGTVRQLTGRLLNLQGLCLSSLGRFDDAVAVYERGIETSYDRAELHINLAVALAAKGATGRAMAEFEEGMRLDPRSVDARLGHGRLLMRFRRLSQAAETLDEAHRIDPEDTRVQLARAELYELRGDVPGAIETWEWIDLRTPTSDSAGRLGELLRDRDVPQSTAWFLRCLDRDRGRLDCREAAAQLLLERGAAQRSRELLEAHFEELSEGAFHNLCLALQQLSQRESLEQILSRRAPKLAATWGVLALARRESGDLDAGLTAARSGLGIAIGDAALLNLEAVILYDLGRREEARMRWERILELHPEDENAQKNLDELFPG